MATKITECGLRSSIARMLKAVQKNDRDTILYENPSLYLYREDGCMYEVVIQNNCFHRANTAATPIYEVILRWHGEPFANAGDIDFDVEDSFVKAMDRYMGSSMSCIVLDAINANMVSVRNNGDFIPDMMKRLHRLMSLTLCGSCEKNIIGDDHMICLSCHVGLNEKDLSVHMCGVCHERCDAEIEQTPCCKQWIHHVCKENSGPTCPFCRANLKTMI